MKTLLTILAMSLLASTAFGQLVITGVVDGPLSGGVPKAVELCAVMDIADLSEYGLGSANNGGGSDDEEFTFPAVAVSQGDFIYVASEEIGFTDFFGFAPDYISSAANINGDDAIELFKGRLHTPETTSCKCSNSCIISWFIHSCDLLSLVL